jgi:hypothetical protein
MITRLVFGALLTDLSIILAAFLYLGARNPKNPWWVNDQVMTWVLPLITGGIVVGPFLLVEGLFFSKNGLAMSDLITTLVILGAGAVFLLLMRIPRRVAAYEAMGASPQGASKG